jgi:hypothetical protein
MTISEKTCCICDQSFVGHGHNPEPFDGEIGECCDDCNDRYVVPIRILYGRDGNDALLAALRSVARLGAANVINTKAAREWVERERGEMKQETI